MTRPTVDVDKLPPTQYMIMEVLAARYRLGETIWPFPSTVAHGLRMLEAAGLIVLHSPNANMDSPGWRRPIPASLTAAGRDATLDPNYKAPAERVDWNAEAFEFAKAMADPAVRLQLAHDGFVSGSTVIVGRHTQAQPESHDGGPRFRVWRDPSVPGGWTGRPELATCPRCKSPLTPCATCGKPSSCGGAWCTEHEPDGAL